MGRPFQAQVCFLTSESSLAVSDELIIRAFQPADVEATLALWGTEYDPSRPWNEPRQAVVRKLARFDGQLIVGERHGELVATIAIGYDGIRGWIYSLIVAPQHRRQGIGRKMLAAAESKLQDEGCPKVNLQVRETNADVVRFYNRCGFATEDRVSLGKALSSETTSSVSKVPRLKVDDGLTLSALRAEDKPALMLLLNETKQIHDHTAQVPYPYTEVDADVWMYKNSISCLERNGMLNWAIRNASDELIGGVGFHDMCAGEKAELGYWLGQSYWGKGVMTRVVVKLCKFAFEHYHLRRIHAQVYAANVASARVLEKAEFSLEGTLRGHFIRDGEAQDVLLFGRLHPDS